MKSVKARLAEHQEAVLDVTRTFGRFRAMEQFHVSDYACFSKWLQEVTGDENFGINPKIKLDNHQSLGDQIVDAFLHKVAQLESENERLKQRASYLEWQLSQSSVKAESQALAVLSVCEA